MLASCAVNAEESVTRSAAPRSNAKRSADVVPGSKTTRCRSSRVSSAAPDRDPSVTPWTSQSIGSAPLGCRERIDLARQIGPCEPAIVEQSEGPRHVQCRVGRTRMAPKTSDTPESPPGKWPIQGIPQAADTLAARSAEKVPSRASTGWELTLRVSTLAASRSSSAAVSLRTPARTPPSKRRTGTPRSALAKAQASTPADSPMTATAAGPRAASSASKRKKSLRNQLCASDGSNIEDNFKRGRWNRSK